MNRYVTAMALCLGLWATGARAGGDAAPQPGADLPFEGDQSTAPSWVSTPNGDDFAQYYPKLAAEVSLGGRAVMHCDVAETGELQGCAIVTETPTGMGFGDAALGMSQYFRMKPHMVDGRPQTSTVTIPIRFQPPPMDATPPDAASAPAVSAKAMDLARRVEAVMQGPDEFDANLARTREAMMSRFDGQSMTEQQQAMIDDYLAAARAAQPTIIEAQARELATRLTEQQLSDVATFVESPSGKAWLTGFRADNAAQTAEWQREGAATTAKARDLFCAKYACFDAAK